MRSLFLSLVVSSLSVMPVLSQSECTNTFTGRVLDRETGQPLAFATISILEEQKGATSDENGYFIVDGICADEFSATISYLGYKASTHHHDLYHQTPEIYLSPDHVLMESVVIEAESEEALHTGVFSYVNIKSLEAKNASSFGDLMGQLPGVSVVTTGQNIARPVIHGLYGNRILIINNGIRHEYQSWGTEHAPEIDPTMGDSYEVIKGAATVHYGPDALGGVLVIKPVDLNLESPYQLKVGSRFHSNGRSYGTDVKTGQGFKNWAYTASGSFVNQGDLHTPDYNLTNTGKKEFSYAGGLKFHKRNVTVESRYSRFNQSLGILRGSVNGNFEDLIQAVNSEIPNETGPFSYKINQPFQSVDHQLALLKVEYLLTNQSFTLNAAHQLNQREEYDVRRGSATLTPNIDLRLATRSIDFGWIHPQLGKFSGESGIQWQYQDNNNVPGTRTAQYIPNFNYYRIGVFLIESIDLTPFKLETGLRYDFHKTSVRGVFQSTRYSNEFDFHRLTYTAGILKKLSEHSSLRVNFGSAWRPPNVAELYAFGRHQSVYEYGFWTFDGSTNSAAILTQKDKKVEIESGYKLIGSVDIRTDERLFQVSLYANFIHNYIYSKPRGLNNTVRGAFPYFIYDQSNALLWGGDFKGQVDHNENWASTFSASYLWARDVRTGDDFVGLPPADFDYKLTFTRGLFDKAKLILDAGVRYTCRQFQVPRVIAFEEILAADENDVDLFAEDNSNFDFTKAPKGFLLAHLGASVEFRSWELGVGATNLFNKSYRSYTDRLRYYADEVGRDISLLVRWSL